MKINRIYIFYGVAIITLGLYTTWLKQKYTERQQFYNSSITLLRGTFNVISSNFMVNFAHLNQISDDVEFKYDTTLKKTIETANLAQTFCDGLFNMVPLCNKSFNTALAHSQSDSIESTWQALNEHFNMLGVKPDLDKDHFIRAKSLFLHGTDTQQELEYLIVQNRPKIQINAILHKTYERLNNRRRPWFGCLPVMTLEQNCLKVGKTIKGTLEFAAYANNWETITMKVDKKALPLTGPIGTFVSTFQEYPQKKIPIKITQKVIITGESRVYEKEFILEACQ